MKTIRYNRLVLIVLLFTTACSNTRIQQLPPEQFITNPGGEGQEISILFSKGTEHNHPLMALWLEDMEGNYIQTLYVARSIATGVFGHGDASSGAWKPGEIRRPAALPVWSHNRGIRASDGLYVPDSQTPVPDAYTGATPAGDFLLKTKTDKKLEGKARLLFEINQTWDWNEYWTNNKFPDNDEYKTSCQPALVYETIIDFDNPAETYTMEVIGHSHYAGENGELYPDLSTMTTALEIVKEIRLRVGEE